MYLGGNDADSEFSASTDEGGRTKFAKYQIVGLRNAFAANPYPDKEGYRNISERLNISNKTLHSWFQNHRHREKIQSKYSDQVDQFEDDLVEDDDSRTPYNPGHKKTKFSDHQRYYLQSFFSEKEYVDEDDISDLSAELMLSPKVIRIWFQHARERKKKNLPILPSSRGRGRGRGSSRGLFPSDRPRGRPRLGRPPKIRESSGFEDFYDLEDDSVSEDMSRKSIEDVKASLNVPTSNAKVFTEFQKVFLGDFYADIKNPDSDDLDYICEHVNATRLQIIKWFENRNKNNPSNQSNAVKICSDILKEVIDSLQPQEVSSVKLESSFSCPYCGISFPEEHLLKEHEKIEAIEFEKEALKFKEETKIDDGAYVTLGDNSEDWLAADLDDAEMFDEDDEDNEFFSGEDSRDHFSSQDGSQYVKRPLNPFMIWLQEERKKLSGDSTLDRTSRSTGELVKDLSVVWKSMSEFDKMPYMEESRRLKEIHKREHPNYIFNPNRKKTNTTPKSGVKYARRANLVKSYICKRCQVGFTTKGNLFKHLRNFHPDSPYDPKYYELGNERSEERNLKQCEQCNMVFISKIGLGRHMLRVHNDSRRFDGLYTEDSAGDTDRFDAKRDSTSPRAFGLNYSEPVSSSSDGYYQNPSDDDFSYEKKVHVKTRFTAYQRRVLMDSFHSSISMTKCDAKKLYFSLADSLQLPAKIVRIWFQNARSARKRGKPIFSDF